MRTIKRQVKQKEVSPDTIQDKQQESDITPKDPPALLSHSDLLALQAEYIKKLEKLEIENLKLKSENLSQENPEVSKSLSNNLQKFLTAITEEAKLQKTEWPTLSTNKLRKKYKVTANSFGPCLEFGLKNKYFERKQISYSGSVPTFSYKKLKGL